MIRRRHRARAAVRPRNSDRSAGFPTRKLANRFASITRDRPDRESGPARGPGLTRQCRTDSADSEVGDRRRGLAVTRTARGRLLIILVATRTRTSVIMIALRVRPASGWPRRPRLPRATAALPGCQSDGVAAAWHRDRDVTRAIAAESLPVKLEMPGSYSIQRQARTRRRRTRVSRARRQGSRAPPAGVPPAPAAGRRSESEST